MTKSNILKLASGPSIVIDKDLFTVGVGTGYDLSLPGTSDEIGFSVRSRGEHSVIIPVARQIRVNGEKCKAERPLNECDRIEWQNNVILFMSGDGQPVQTRLSRPEMTAPSASAPLDVFKALAQDIGSGSPLAQSLQITLLSLLEQASAEGGTLVCENSDASSWRVLATTTTSERNGGSTISTLSHRELVSHTLLGEAISTAKPVYIESLIGHDYASQKSLINARVFSVACVPLLKGNNHVFGALFLYTWQPGRSIRRATLETVQIIATQAALLFLSHHELQASQAENRRLRTVGSSHEGAIAFDRSNPNSPMAQVLDRIVKLAPHDLSILIRGETGTGKELVAREVHKQSGRAKGPFVALNCAAIPPTLMESILFGSSKGAYTGSVKDKEGKFTQANGGTLFLDEIGDLSLELQTKLLRVLQEKEVEPVGGTEATPVDVRILSATHQNLETLVNEGKFRKDLYYRLNGATVALPTLASRGEADIQALAEMFLRRLDSEASITSGALNKLKSHSWPGNVRELEQVLSRAFAFCQKNQITESDIELDEALSSPRGITLFDAEMDSIGSLKLSQEKFTLHFVKKVLDRCQGNRAKAAGLLGISERTLYRLLANDKSTDNFGSELLS